MTPPVYANPIPFGYFAELVHQISRCTAKPRTCNALATTTDRRRSKQIRLVESWIDKVKATHAHGLDDPLPSGTIVIFFRLLFPEEGVRRRYGLQEYTFAKELETLYRVGEGTFASWCQPSEGARTDATGCLGDTVRQWMERKGKCSVGNDNLTLGRVDELLDELAATSEYSANDVRNLRALPAYRARTVSTILYDLLHGLEPFQTSLMIQVILRDISPILYPAPSNSVSIALSEYNTTCYDRLDLARVMDVWDTRMTKCFRSVADLDWVATTVESWIRSGEQGTPEVSPTVGLPIKVPKSERPGTCARATKHLSGKVAAETKYDGERLQVHVDLTLPLDQQIKIFSKSGRDSTKTRHLLHPIIRASLGLDIGDRFASNHHLLLATRAHSVRLATGSTAGLPCRLVLEGEMVPYNEDTHLIDEFWKLAFVKTDSGPRSEPSSKWTDRATPETGDTGDPPTPVAPGARPTTTTLHLKIVWFDILVTDTENLCELPYCERRARLEKLVRPIPGFSMLAERVLIDFAHPPSALENLRLHFAKIITDRCEGLMLKPLSSKYNDARRGQKWIKLKKDFIPGAGDTLDFVLVGASWQKHRARELLVPPSVYTTFFVGLEANELGAPITRANKRHYHILFSTSYGLDRHQLDRLCHSIRQGYPQRFDPSKLTESTFRQVPAARGRYRVYESACTSFTFSLADHLHSFSTRPAVIFAEPRAVELNGAGFQQTPGCPYYELRWPRFTKSARDDAQPLSLSALQATAREAMQIAPEPTESQVISDLFNWSKSRASPARSKETKDAKYAREWRDWVKRLEHADGVFGDSTRLPCIDLDASSLHGPTRVDGDMPIIEAQHALSSPSRLSRPLLSACRAPVTPPRRSRTLGEVNLSPIREVVVVSSPNQHVPRPFPLSASSPNLRLDSPVKRRLVPELHRDAKSIQPDGAERIPTNRSKRRRTSCPNPVRRTSSTPLLSSLVTQLIEPRPSGDVLAGSPFSAHSWSLFPPLPSKPSAATPLHPFLDASNYLSSPINVLWAAGALRATHRPVRSRQGYIFVSRGCEEDAIAWAQLELREGGDNDVERRTVWLLRERALSTSGLGTGDEILMIL
ncbi:hypothetical protein JCM11491_002348 [Sporobolomyces phaffii]